MSGFDARRCRGHCEMLREDAKIMRLHPLFRGLTGSKLRRMVLQDIDHKIGLYRLKNARAISNMTRAS